MHHKNVFLILFFLGLTTFLYSQDPTILRSPALNSDGSQLSFSYQGDIWTVPTEGGQARRLTIHEAYESMPEWSPDDKHLVFNSNRYGGFDLFTMTPAGGDLRQMTYHSASDYDAHWRTKDELVFSTRRNFAQVERENEYYSIPSDGGTPTRFLDALGLESASSEDGKLFAFVRGTCREAREAYRGPANRNIWVYNPKKDSYNQITNDDGQDTDPDWGTGRDLYFRSARSGVYNIYKVELDKDGNTTSEMKAITKLKDEGITDYDISRDGNTLVYIYKMEVYIQDLSGSASAKKINISTSEDYRFDPVKYEDVSRGVSEYSLSPNEDYLAFIAKGEILIKKNDKESKLTVAPYPNSHREYNVAWLNDSTLLFLSDRDGDYDLYQLKAKEGGDLFTAFEWVVTPFMSNDEEMSSFQLSPDHMKIAMTTIDGRLTVSELDTLGAITESRTLLDGWAQPAGVTWSPDSRWLAYSQSDLNFNQDVFILPADGSSQPVNISMHPRGDYGPVWSPDGSKIGFRSIRNNGDSDIWFAWLKKSDWQKTRQDWDELEDDEDSSPDSILQIDVDGIHERLVQVTRQAGNEYNLIISKDGEEFYYSTNGGGRKGSGATSTFRKVKWNGKDGKKVLSNGRISSLALDDEGKNIYYRQRGKMKKLSLSNSKSTSLPFSVTMKMNEPAIRAQVFDEAWRTLRDRFYDPQFHGRDWQELRKTWEPRALAASTSQDFRYIFNLMLGQLDASHMGIYGSDEEKIQRLSTGILGLELDPVDQGVRITRIVPESPADREESKLYLGEIITHINGNAIGNDNFYKLLTKKNNDRIQLTLISSDTMRKVVIRPTSSTRNLLYKEWVQDRKDLVEEYSEGRLGYIHIRGMNWSSFEEFERELMASGYGKEGVVIDVRYNGGGWTTDMVMTVLNVRQHAYTVPRGATDNLEKTHTNFSEYYPYGERLPLSSWTKPSVALCNQNSYSNAEIFSHAYQNLGHGQLVGVPTFGAVISTGGKGLMDGSFVRVPFRAWYVKATGKNMEHQPAVPDHIIFQEPNSRAKGEDPQLNKAVEVLLEQIDG